MAYFNDLQAGSPYALSSGGRGHICSLSRDLQQEDILMKEGGSNAPVMTLMKTQLLSHSSCELLCPRVLAGFCRVLNPGFSV